MSKTSILTPAQYVARLQELLANQASPPAFRVGQLVRRTRVSLPIEHRGSTVLSIAGVVEVFPSLRTHTGDESDTNGPAMRIAYLDPEGGYHESNAEAWMYEALTPEQILEITGQTAH